MNILITSKEIESVIQKLPRKKSPGQHGFRGKFSQIFTEELTPILPKLFQKIEEKTLPNSFYETSIILIAESDKDSTKKENYKSLSLMSIEAKILNKMLAN